MLKEKLENFKTMVDSLDNEFELMLKEITNAIATDEISEMTEIEFIKTLLFVSGKIQFIGFDMTELFISMGLLASKTKGNGVIQTIVGDVVALHNKDKKCNCDVCYNLGNLMAGELPTKKFNEKLN